MKKLIMFLLLSVMVLTLFTGCGDEDDDGGTTSPTPQEMEDMDFIMTMINGMYGRAEYGVMIMANEENATLESAELVINGVIVPLETDDYMTDIYFGFYDVAEGTNLACEITINGDLHELDLIASDYPVVTWPTAFDPTMSYDISWELGIDSQYQIFGAYGSTIDWEIYEVIEEDDRYVELDTSARSYTMPANWILSGLESYDLLLQETSFDYNSDIAAICVSASSAMYEDGWEKRDNLDLNAHKRLQKIVEELRKK